MKRGGMRSAARCRATSCRQSTTRCARCPPAKLGKLAVKGPTGCRYLSDERQAKFVRDGWNLPGDTVRIDADGYVFYQARADDMIVSAGYNISGPEVESALMQHEAVAECGVIGAADEERGQIVKAFVVLNRGYVAGRTHSSRSCRISSNSDCTV